jgi:hypothetical protein
MEKCIGEKASVTENMSTKMIEKELRHWYISL